MAWAYKKAGLGKITFLYKQVPSRGYQFKMTLTRGRGADHVQAVPPG
jgi:hypothetical protein